MYVSRMKPSVVRMKGEYATAVDAHDESEALAKADAIPLEQGQAAWSPSDAEPESHVCDECRSYGPHSPCDCRS